MSRRKALRKTSLLALLEKVAWNKARQSEWPGTRPGRVQWPRPASGQWLEKGQAVTTCLKKCKASVVHGSSTV